MSRHVLLAELPQYFTKTGLHETVLTTGPRKGFAMCLVKPLPSETASQLKVRMISIAQAVRASQLPTMELGKQLWANLSRPNAERMRLLIVHCGKLKRLVLEKRQDMKGFSEAEYKGGGIWLMAKLGASCSRPCPPGHSYSSGKIDGPWILDGPRQCGDSADPEGGELLLLWRSAQEAAPVFHALPKASDAIVHPGPLDLAPLPDSAQGPAVSTGSEFRLFFQRRLCGSFVVVSTFTW